MKNSLMYLMAALVSASVSSQTHFRNGYDVSYDVVGAIPSRDMSFTNNCPWDAGAGNYISGGNVAPSGGMKNLTKLQTGGIIQSTLFMDNGNSLDIDLGSYPYLTMRIQSSANKDITMNVAFQTTPGISKSFTVKGNNLWNIIRIDFSDQQKLGGGTAVVINWSFTEPAGTTLPYELYIDYIRFGGVDDKGTGHTLNTGDPDSTIKMGIEQVADQVCEKDGGEQTVNISGISNGTDVTLISLSQTNSKTTIFEGTPAFSSIQPDGTATMTYIPKASTIGVSNVHLLATYNRGDSIIKYKSIWFNISVITDPKITVPSSVKALMNQPKVNMKVTNATNSTGGASKLKLTAAATNSLLITNLVADPVKSDGTCNISFIPGQDLCGTDTITTTIYDSISARTKDYKIMVEVEDKTGICNSNNLINVRKSELMIFPNPATDRINISLPGNKGGNIMIVDITGRTVMQIAVAENKPETAIDVSNLNPGVYFIYAETNKSVKKLVIRQ